MKPQESLLFSSKGEGRKEGREGPVFTECQALDFKNKHLLSIGHDCSPSGNGSRGDRELGDIAQPLEV